MSAMKSRVSLRALVLTPERIPTFIIPSLFPASPMFRRGSLDHSRLLSEDDDEDSSGTGPVGTPRSPSSSPWRRLRPRSPRRLNADAAEAADPATRAATLLPHVGKLTTPYGFRGVLTATPSSSRRESLFHRRRPVTVTVTEPDADPVEPPSDDPCAAVRSRVSLRPVKSLGLKVMAELRKPAAALKALSPSHR